MAFYKLSKEDIDAINNWHFPLSYEGFVDIDSPLCVCDTDDKIDYMRRKLTNRLEYAYNTYRKYRQDPAFKERTHWLIEVIALTAKIDPTIIPEDLRNVVDLCQRWQDTNPQSFDERDAIRTKIYHIIDIYMSANKFLPKRKRK